MAKATPDEIAAAKKAERSRLAAIRSGIEPRSRARQSHAVCDYAADWIARSALPEFMAYVPFRSELDTHSLMQWGWENGIGVIIPRCDPSARQLTLYRIQSPDDLAAGAYGIMEPDPSRLTPLPRPYVPAVILLPGLGFDGKGGRLGYGGGYYDRFLQELDAECASRGIDRPLRFGLAYTEQIVSGVLMEDHDERLDGTITEHGIELARRE
ncbi:hypothetical protein VN24_03990 [Paenibacillus beijingensis]|uniref:5-formyltetrahydrofolate cyclo-ligase n=2 Tax=Paenibacillus beijingensis TaxID=1126833 RepID=A0A0D5NEV9_9BACL|nr:hypothetical protein VN24_03990 [Paenibacillus beijingensis]